MPVQQLDLFGTTLKPPQKIKEDIPVENIQTASKELESKLEKNISEDLSANLVRPENIVFNEKLDTNEPEEHREEFSEEIIGEQLEIASEMQVNAENAEIEWLSETELNEVVDDVFTDDFLDEEEPISEEEAGNFENLSTNELIVDEEILEEIPDLEAEVFNNDLEIKEPSKLEKKETEPDLIFSEEDNYHLTPRNIQPALRGRKPIHHYDEEAGNLRIPTDDILFKRQYYNMRETAAMFGVNQSLLRFWENEFSVLQPKKNKKGDRYFRPADIKNLHLIYNLLRVRKFTMEGAKEFLQKNKKAADQFELVNKLDKLKLFLLELKATL